MPLNQAAVRSAPVAPGLALRWRQQGAQRQRAHPSAGVGARLPFRWVQAIAVYGRSAVGVNRPPADRVRGALALTTPHAEESVVETSENDRDQAAWGGDHPCWSTH